MLKPVLTSIRQEAFERIVFGGKLNLMQNAQNIQLCGSSFPLLAVFDMSDKVSQYRAG